jgi:hypothetical protein
VALGWPGCHPALAQLCCGEGFRQPFELQSEYPKMRQSVLPCAPCACALLSVGLNPGWADETTQSRDLITQKDAQ